MSDKQKDPIFKNIQLAELLWNEKKALPIYNTPYAKLRHIKNMELIIADINKNIEAMKKECEFLKDIITTHENNIKKNRK